MFYGPERKSEHCGYTDSAWVPKQKNTLVMLVMYHQIEKGRSWWDGREPWEWGVGSDGMRTENSKVV